MKRMLLIGTAILACQLIFAGMASAATYTPSNDKYINVNLPVSLPDLGTGALTFNTQQALYANVITPVLKPTGLTFNYFYTWVTVNGSPILAVDPAKVGF
ncbi:hypothetical protein [Paenibacillus silvisoli]|uniref:hypothetical protein n=1 Tax=Paenibacillus silvisoli TaxID=3110539 RepID=UPI002803B82A|nr:hypothetical protein [Paenibacillus silvisoli]